MKVLSIQEPYATLIAFGYKKIETRSWKTSYRGEININASLSKNFYNSIKDKSILKLINSLNMNYGKIICKATLIDCIETTKEYIEKIK